MAHETDEEPVDCSAEVCACVCAGAPCQETRCRQRKRVKRQTPGIGRTRGAAPATDGRRMSAKNSQSDGTSSVKSTLRSRARWNVPRKETVAQTQQTTESHSIRTGGGARPSRAADGGCAAFPSAVGVRGTACECGGNTELWEARLAAATRTRRLPSHVRVPLPRAACELGDGVFRAKGRGGQADQPRRSRGHEEVNAWRK